jgi:hypothetical protein
MGRGISASAFGTKLPFAAVQNYVRFLTYSGRELLAVRLSHFDPGCVKTLVSSFCSGHIR